MSEWRNIGIYSMISILWCIWLQTNECVFQGIRAEAEQTIYRVKELSINWNGVFTSYNIEERKTTFSEKEAY